MTTTGTPVSAVLKTRATEGDEPKKKTREEWKKAKELEEARKAGTVPAAVDEEGKDINPHIPQYIATAPWYFSADGPTLKHQRPQPEKQKEFNHLNEYYVRGLKGSKVNKYRKGACENCGAVGHDKKNCFERPRKVGAKFMCKDVAADDVLLPKLALDYDGKRDRWNGYDPSEYKAVVDEHEKVEEYKRQLKATKLKEFENTPEDENEEDIDDDEDKYAENIDMPGTKVDSKQRITVRNLRIREDTAKYLRNLDPNSAYYDPKTRSMRDNPYINTGKGPTQVDYAGENFVRFSGDTVKQAKAQLFAWEAYEKGVDVSLQAEPTKLELLQKQFAIKKEEYKVNVSNELLEKYGGKEHLDAPPKELLIAQTEDYVEYSRHGKIIKGAEKQIIRSRYEEDIYPNNHLSVWGSYWCNGSWGYKCCYSFVRNSYCTGESGKQAVAGPVIPDLTVSNTAEKSLVEIKQENKKSKKKKKRMKKIKENHNSNESSSNSDDEEERKRKLRKALIKAKIEEDAGKVLSEMDDKERKYNSMFEVKKLSEEDIEAYQLRRQRPDDPMAAFLNK